VVLTREEIRVVLQRLDGVGPPDGAPALRCRTAPAGVLPAGA
jgi:hypothetical protein